MESLLTTSLFWQVLEFSEVIYEYEYTITVSSQALLYFKLEHFPLTCGERRDNDTVRKVTRE